MVQIARQHWSAERYAETAHFVPALGVPVLELLAPSPGKHILDLGCGDGILTQKIVAAGARVIAVGAGPDMVAAARARGIDARVMDGQRLTFSGEFDAVFSNAALHWMRDQQAVLAGVYRALKPGGRFVGEMGGHNTAASAEAHRKKLEQARFTVEGIAIIPRPTTLPTGIEAWLDTFCEDFLGAITDCPDRSRARGEIADLLRPALMDETGTWIADYVCLRFRATRAL